MLIRARNIKVAPFFWKVQRKWPLDVVVEIDATASECAEISADPRFAVEAAVEGDPEPAKRGPGRPRKTAGA